MAAEFPSARAQDLFLRARDVPRETRDTWLRDTCGGDPGLLHMVEGLLAADEEDGLEPPSQTTVASWFEPAALPDLGARRIGSCRLVRRIAEGGMGRLYEAVQEPPGRRVAVKVLRQAFPDDLARARFEDEARLLAAVDHPGVCRVFEAGTWTTDSGESVPYCAMELVEDAKPITAFAAEGHLAVDERVRLLVEVCAAVSASHAKGVLHRDLKPGNVLVGRDGRPKVIDFGIARTLDDRGRAHGRLTRSGMLLGTPAYMSPEQLLGRPEDVDVRADVHALGVLLYETLTGRLPRDLGDGSLGDAVRALRERTPTSPDRVDPAVPRDLAAVCLKAVDAEAARRYASVAAFQADLERWLRGEPVEARPAGALRATGMWVRRHRSVSALGLALVAALAAVAVVSAASAGREREARETADRQRDRAEAFLRAGKDFVPWLLDDHQRRVAGLPRSQPVVSEFVKGVREHLRALSYEKTSDPDLLLSAARSFLRLANVEGGFGVDKVGLKAEAREDAEVAIQLTRRVRTARPDPETHEIESGAELLLARLDKAAGDGEGAMRHAAAATAAAAAGLAAGSRFGDQALDAVILRAELREGRGAREGALDDLRVGLRSALATRGGVTPLRLLDAHARMARVLMALGRAEEARSEADAMALVAEEWEKETGATVEARRELFRGLGWVADGAIDSGRSPTPWFDRALLALDRWRQAAPEHGTTDREEAALRRRASSILLDEKRYEESLVSARKADAIALALLKDDRGDVATWEIHAEAVLAEGEVLQRLGRTDEMERRMADGEAIVEHIVKAFPAEKEAWVSRCRLVLTRSAIDTFAAEVETDPAKRRELLERAEKGTREGAALYREAGKHGLDPAYAESVAVQCDAEAERLRQLVQVGPR